MSLPVQAVEIHNKPVQVPPLSISNFYEVKITKKFKFIIYPLIDDNLHFGGFKFIIRINSI